MITYKDITYCVRQCSNMQCKRNIKHLDNFETSIIGKNFSNCEIYMPISQASFDKCENWREDDGTRESN